MARTKGKSSVEKMYLLKRMTPPLSDICSSELSTWDDYPRSEVASLPR